MSYVDGFVAAVPVNNKQAYLEHAQIAAEIFKKHGALSVVECWGDDVPDGELNSLNSAVMRKPDEAVVFSWVVWESKEARDSGWGNIMDDPDMPQNMPFDGKRIIYGGFQKLLEA
nr:DUF1428 domain-containing protein [Oceanococcus sp. HetDA_MAG_MS8]